jgi:HEAT repeat protein
VQGLSQLGGDDVLESLCEALKDPEWSVRYHAALGLAKLKNRRAVMPLIQAVFDPHPQAALQIIRALEELGDPRAIDILKRVASANIPEVSSAAQKAARALQEVAQAEGFVVPTSKRSAKRVRTASQPVSSPAK